MYKRIERFNKTTQKTRQRGEHLFQLMSSTVIALIVPGDELEIATIDVVTGSIKVQLVRNMSETDSDKNGDG